MTINCEINDIKNKVGDTKHTVLKLAKVMNEFENEWKSKLTEKEVLVILFIILIEFSSLNLGYLLSGIELTDESNTNSSREEVLEAILDSIRKSVVDLLKIDLENVK